jgi:hypothetical protein
MNATITQDMADGMDDMAGLLPPHPPAPTNSAFFWQGQPSIVGAQLRPRRVDRSTEARRYCYPVEGQAAGEASFHRRAAIRLGGI